jgi:hypothetical protein
MDMSRVYLQEPDELRPGLEGDVRQQLDADDLHHNTFIRYGGVTGLRRKDARAYLI